MKVVVNKCYGGFSISDKAVRRMAELKGLTLYPEVGDFGFVIYWTVPPTQQSELDYDEATFDIRPEDRADPHLIQVVEELGAEANGSFANLEITEIPDDVQWEVEEYDGMEWVAEKHRTW